MKAIIGPLMPPNTPPGLPHGLDRGGVFHADYIPGQYIDAVRKTVPTDSPISPDVSADVFARPVAFSDPNTPRKLTRARPLGQLPTVVRPFGQNVQGMGPQPGYRLYDPDPRPMPVQAYHAVPRPQGDVEGGIFGRGRVIGGMAVGPRVPGVTQREVFVERTVRPLTGFGAGPDGLGR